jgi:plastocyanin
VEKRDSKKIRARYKRRGAWFFASIFAPVSLYAADLDVTVLDVDGNPVPDVVVYVEPERPRESAAASKTAVLDQVDTRFVPHVLTVQAGTSIRFPNSDVVAHHVYSFSSPNQFVLPLYKGNEHPPVRFEHPGIVTVGCNIHDDMLAYIFVVDSPVFATTDDRGQVSLTLDITDNYSVRIWSPRFRDKDMRQFQTVNAGSSANITFSLIAKLHDSHSDGSDVLAWQDY